jgi:hypothetical protein
MGLTVGKILFRPKSFLRKALSRTIIEAPGAHRNGAVVK